MDETVRELLALAFRTVAARDANDAIAAMRNDEAQEGKPARSYEVVVPEAASSEWLHQTVLPRLVYHLESIGARPPAFGGIVLSMFTGEKLHFVRVADFLPAAARLAHSTVDALYSLFGTGERRTAIRDGEPPVLLPSKRE